MKGGWLIPVVLVGIMAGDFGRELNRWSHLGHVFEAISLWVLRKELLLWHLYNA
jgi:hypothetical protein